MILHKGIFTWPKEITRDEALQKAKKIFWMITVWNESQRVEQVNKKFIWIKFNLNDLY